ncbi:MAG: DUF3179 domain-containing protein [Rhodobacteraceae bacterium]|nr:DUF3179 domain-containing protein [Paracoccaceae bacterium]
MRAIKSIFSLLVFGFTLQSLPLHALELDDEQLSILSTNVVFGTRADHLAALDKLGRRGNPDMVATLILGQRFRGNSPAVSTAISQVTGRQITDWKGAMLWQESHPDVIPHHSYRDLKLIVYERIDPEFLRFLGDGRSDRTRMKIRLEEITWGGVGVDAIPSLDNPRMIKAPKASYLKGDDLVFGVRINGDARAYPLRIMGWHEMFNDTIGGVPVALAYCTLCGSGILFETHVKGRTKPFVFGSSGFLYRSNKLMFDRETDSLWNQFTGQPVTGPLVDADIELTILPVAITSWDKWQAANPDTKVLSLKTGHKRDYGSGVVYNAYFSSPDLMFPVVVGDESVLRRKDYVFGIRDFGAAKAWPVQAFATRHVINDTIGDKPVVLIGNAATRSVRAYESGGRRFELANDPSHLQAAGTAWKITEEALIAPDGATLPRVAGHISYWFAWDGYLGISSKLYTP